MHRLFGNLVVALLVSFAVSSNAVKRSRFSFYEMPVKASGPCDMTPGPDGAIWVQDLFISKIARIDTNTSEIEEYDIPYKNKPLTRNHLPNIKGRTPIACSVQFGADGMLYAVTGLRNELARINPKTKEVKVFSQSPKDPTGNLEPFNDLSPGKTGIYFTQTTANLVTFFDYKTHEFRNYKVPTKGAVPLGVFVAADESVWVLELSTSKLARLNATTNTWKEWQLPASLAQPIIMRVQQGKYLYFTAVTGNGVGRFDMNTGATKAFTASTPGLAPGSEIADSQGNIWYSSLSQNVLAKLNPRTGVTKIIRLPILVDGGGINPPTLGLSLTYGPVPNSILFPVTLANRVGRLQLLRR